MKKITALLLAISCIFVLYSPLTVRAEEKITMQPIKDRQNEPTEFNATIYKGQAANISFTYEGKVVKPSKVKWKITEGKKYVKIAKNKKTIKGLKAGTAVLEGSYKDKQTTFTITVKKAPKNKTGNLTMNGVTVNIPTGYDIISEETSNSLSKTMLSSTGKKNGAITLFARSSKVNPATLDDKLWEQVNSELVAGAVNAIQRLAFDFVNAGFEIEVDESTLTYSAVHNGMASASCRFELKYFGSCWVSTIYWLKGDQILSASIVSYDENANQLATSYLIENNPSLIPTGKPVGLAETEKS